jgi:POT family proton-dependent oligopeptide transporter
MNKPNTGEFLGHPKGLFLLFGTEMWERMSYYGLRGILVLYLTHATTVGVMGWDHMSTQELQSNALSYLGLYAFLVYVTPVLGGWLADNVIGQRKSIIIGGITMMLGQFALATPYNWIPGLEKEFLFLGLGLLIIGNGFFKPNISTMVGDLYEEGDHRRDGAFTIFYMGINLGSILGYFIVGTIAEKVDYQYGFLAAGIGMLLGVILQLVSSQKYLGDLGREPSAKLSKTQSEGGIVQPLTKEERDRIKVILIMSFFTIVFWMGFEQAAGSMNLFAKNQTDLVFFGWEMPASWLQSVNPLFIIILAPFFASLWINMGDKEPNSTVKFSLAFFFLGLGFLCMVGAALQIGDSGEVKAHVLWLVGAYLFHTIGELCLSPIGLSMVTKLAPMRYLSLMMGMWFFFSGIGNYAAAEVGKLVGETGPLEAFGGVVIASFVSGIVLFLIRERLVDWMHGAEDSSAHTLDEKLEEELSVTATHDGVAENHN